MTDIIPLSFPLTDIIPSGHIMHTLGGILIGALVGVIHGDGILASVGTIHGTHGDGAPVGTIHGMDGAGDGIPVGDRHGVEIGIMPITVLMEIIARVPEEIGLQVHVPATAVVVSPVRLTEATVQFPVCLLRAPQLPALQAADILPTITEDIQV